MKYKLGQFQGPLDLLLSLIRERKMEITEVALAEVTAQYLRYLEENREQIGLENLSFFLQTAVSLIFLKSKALLPILVLEQAQEEEEAVDLAERLEIYRRFSLLAETLGESLAERKVMFVRRLPPRRRQAVFKPPEEVGAENLRDFFADVLREIPVLDQLKQERLKKVIALEEKVEGLKNFLRRRGKGSFGDFLSGAKSKEEVVVSFLALLELVRKGEVAAKQREFAGEIEIILIDNR